MGYCFRGAGYAAPVSTTVKHYLKESYEYCRIEYYRARPR